jgi:hypothetical protein
MRSIEQGDMMFKEETMFRITAVFLATMAVAVTVGNAGEFVQGKPITLEPPPDLVKSLEDLIR